MVNNGEVKWGPVQDDDLHTITLPDGNTVDVLYYITEGVESKAQQAAQSRYKLAEKMARQRGKGSDESLMSGAEFMFDNGAYRLSLLQQMIKAWSFTDKNGGEMPVSAANISRLPVHTREFIMVEIDKLNPQTDEESAENLEPSSETSLPETEPAPASLDMPI